MKPTANIKLTKEEAQLLLQILSSAMDDPALESAPVGKIIKADIKRISNKVWGEMVVIQDMGPDESR